MGQHVVIAAANSGDGDAMAAHQVELGQGATGHPPIGDDDSSRVEHSAVERQISVAALADGIAKRGDGRVWTDDDHRIAGHGSALAIGDSHPAFLLDPTEGDVREPRAQLGERRQISDRDEHGPIDDLLGTRWGGRWGQSCRQRQSPSEQQGRHQQHRQHRRRVGERVRHNRVATGDRLGRRL